jgi:hypothetical protein
MDEHTRAILDTFTARRSDDTTGQDLELVCERCPDDVCDVEHGDTLAVLVDVALDHDKDTH